MTPFKPITVMAWTVLSAQTLGSGRAIAQAVSRRLPTAAARVQTRVWSGGILWRTKVALGQVFSDNFGFPCQCTVHSIYFSTIIFIITRGWHNRPGVAAVAIASQSRIKENTGVMSSNPIWGMDVCVLLISVCAVLCICRGLATSWTSPKDVYKIMKFKKRPQL
jgi:hypothetical protein